MSSCFCNQRITYCQENWSLLNLTMMWCAKCGMYCQLDNNVKVYLRELVFLHRLHLFVFLSTSFGAWQLLDKWASWTKSRTITDQRCSSVYLLCGSNVLRIFLHVSKELQNFVNTHWKCKERDSDRYVKIVKIWYSSMCIFPDIYSKNGLQWYKQVL